MKRTIIWTLVVGISLATLATLWFMQNFEQVPVRRHEAPQKEARRNPYLAFERLLQQLGRPAERLESPRALDHLPAGSVLILDESRRRNVSTARAERLLDWVHNGGYLIVAAENASDDPLISRLGLSHYQPSQAQCEPGTKNDAEEEAKDGEDHDKQAAINVNLPGKGIRYRLAHYGRGLSSSSPEPAWRAGSTETRNALLHYPWGEGQITVIDDLGFIDNYGLGKLDHAELIWALLQRYQPQGKVHLASRMEIQTLWQWLADSAWMLLTSAAVLIALWLWQIVPRFGGTQLSPVDERRDLTQHLSAIGRSVWREGGVTHWLSVVRHALNKRLSLRYPDLNRMDASEKRIVLAKIADCKTKDINSALMSSQPQSAEEFTRTMQTLQRLDQRL